MCLFGPSEDLSLWLGAIGEQNMWHMLAAQLQLVRGPPPCDRLPQTAVGQPSARLNEIDEEHVVATRDVPLRGEYSTDDRQLAAHGCDRDDQVELGSFAQPDQRGMPRSISATAR